MKTKFLSTRSLSWLLALILHAALIILIASTLTADAANSFCSRQGIRELKFTGVAAVPSGQDFCSVNEEEVPAAVSALITRIGDVHVRVARTLGIPADELYGRGVVVQFFSHPSGSLRSYTAGDGSAIHMAVFGDWDLASWSSKIYAHELVHFLSFNSGPVRDSLQGLESHPFIVEAFPDLISLSAHDDPVMTLSDPGLPGCLRDVRDETPLHSMRASRERFHSNAHVVRLRNCCESISAGERNARVDALCAEVAYESAEDEDAYHARLRAMGIESWRRTSQELAASFDPKHCLLKVKGLWTLNGCNSYQFAFPLTSFFFVLKEELGRSLIPELMTALRESRADALFQCRYLAPAAASHAEPAKVQVRGFADVLQKLKRDLKLEEQAVFARVWTQHGFDLLIDLDQLFMNDALTVIGLNALGKRNPGYASQNGCLSPYTYRPDFCALQCERMAVRF